MSQVHVITGGSGGIGLECAKMYKQGTVIIAGIHDEQLKEAAEILKSEGIDVKTKNTDVSDINKVKELIDYAKEFGTLKTMIHAAGVSGTIGDVKKTLEIDLLGTYNVIEETYKAVEQDTAVVLIASMMGHMVSPKSEDIELLRNPDKDGALDKLVKVLNGDADEAYNYSKHGVQLLARTNATRFGKKGGRILSISPGIIMTPMSKKAAEEYPERMEYMKSITPAGRNGEPEDIANLIYFLGSNKASFISGTDILIDGGLTLNLQKQEQK